VFADDYRTLIMTRFLQPSRLGVALLLGILVVQGTAFWRTETMYAYGPANCREFTSHRIGMPLVAHLEVTEQNDGSKVRKSRIFPLNAVIVLAGAYLLAMPAAAWLSGRGAPGRGFEVNSARQSPPAAG
jgi:hypothetical protein